jgi:hypothetical protein
MAIEAYVFYIQIICIQYITHYVIMSPQLQVRWILHTYNIHGNKFNLIIDTNT